MPLGRVAVGALLLGIGGLLVLAAANASFLIVPPFFCFAVAGAWMLALRYFFRGFRERAVVWALCSAGFSYWCLGIAVAAVLVPLEDFHLGAVIIGFIGLVLAAVTVRYARRASRGRGTGDLQALAATFGLEVVRASALHPPRARGRVAGFDVSLVEDDDSTRAEVSGLPGLLFCSPEHYFSALKTGDADFDAGVSVGGEDAIALAATLDREARSVLSRAVIDWNVRVSRGVVRWSSPGDSEVPLSVLLDVAKVLSKRHDDPIQVLLGRLTDDADPLVRLRNLELLVADPTARSLALSVALRGDNLRVKHTAALAVLRWTAAPSEMRAIAERIVATAEGSAGSLALSESGALSTIEEMGQMSLPTNRGPRTPKT